MADQALIMLRGQISEIVFGSIFLFVGLSVFCIAAIRRRSGARIFVWLGLWSAMYGSVHLAQSRAVLEVLPHWLQVIAPHAITVSTYLLVVVGSLSFLELSLGRLRLLIKAAAFLGLLIAIAGYAWFLRTGISDKFILYNNLLATCILLVLAIVVAVPGLSRKYLVLADRGVLAIGTFVFAFEALAANLLHPFGFKSPLLLDHFGFAALLFSFGYVALQLVFANERRLLSVESELAIARDIQASILPSHVPQLDNLRISAAYHPMTAVAGDFYEFIPVDHNRIGILVADVSGHGVPAALIASMIKVAMQSVISCADDPRAVLTGLNRVLAAQLRSQFVSAAYLWIDSGNCTFRYSAAGHPPLLRWRQDNLQSIESNGLLFGLLPECGDYPVHETTINPGDRILLYTDGVTEAENANGESFGDRRLEQVVRDNQVRSASELSDRLLSEIRQWQPASLTQQDDITLLVIDVL